MLKIRVTSPFRYQYLNGDDKLIKDHYLAAGNYYHLDPVKDKLEIKYILSPNFTFKNYIDIDPETIPDSLRKELNLEAGLYKDDVQLPLDEEFIPTLIQDNKFIDASENARVFDELNGDPSPLADPSDNPFDQTTPSPTEEVKEIQEDVKEELGAVDMPQAMPLDEPSDEVEDMETGEVEREKRKAELEDLHYSKIQDIAELYDLEYTTKKEVIEEILKLEFEDADVESSRKLEPLN